MSIRIGYGCKIDDSARIGTEPYSHNRNLIKGIWVRKKAKGGISIKEFVSIGAHVSIQKGVTKPTTIGPYTHLNDGVRIGHDVEIGRNCTIGLGSQISGYSEISDNVDIGPGCVVSDHIKIGKRARVRIGSLVLDDIPLGGDYAGRPAKPFDEFKRNRRLMNKLVADVDKEKVSN